MGSKEKRNTVIRGNWFKNDFLDKFLNSNLKLKEHMNDQLFSLNQLNKLHNVNISSRVLNHWYKHGIIIDDRENNKGWKKFSVSEMIWIHIVLKLRKFGLELEKIKVVKDSLDIYNSKENFSKCPLLDYFIGFVLYNKEPVKLLVFETGEAEISPQSEIDLSMDLDYIQEDYISIDLNKLVSKVTYKPEIKADYLNYSSSEIAKEVDKAFYYENIKSLIITNNKGEEFLISKEHIKKSKGEIKSLINKIGNYFEESTISMGNNKVHKLIEKKKIKK